MRFRLRTLLILMAAAPIWIYVIEIMATANRTQRFDQRGMIGGVILLTGISAAVHRLTRQMPDGMAVAVLLSPIISIASMFAAAALDH